MPLIDRFLLTQSPITNPHNYPKDARTKEKL